MLTFRIRLNYPWGTRRVKVVFFYQTLLTDKDIALVDDVWATGNHLVKLVPCSISLGLLDSLDRLRFLVCLIKSKLVSLVIRIILLWANVWE